MTAKEFLGQAYWLDQSINSKLGQIERMRELTQKITVSFSSDPVSHTRNVTAMQDTIDQIVDAEAELNRQIDLLITLKKEIASVISQVRNDTYRLILERRYLCFESWAKIETELHYTKRWLLTIHARALAVVEKLISSTEVSA